MKPTHVLVATAHGVGSLCRRGVNLGRARLAHGEFIEHADGFIPVQRVTTIPAIDGEPLSRTYQRIATALDAEPVRPSGTFEVVKATERCLSARRRRLSRSA